MCGIAGWFTKPGCDWRPSKQLIVEIVKELSSRGRDATGIGTLMDNNDLYIYKGAVPAWEWALSFEKDDVPIGRSGLIHTRGANVGSPDNNNNNHPLPYDPPGGRQVIAVHNGTIGNLQESYRKLGVEPHAEVDSALIAASLGIKGPSAGLKYLEDNSCGSAAIGALWDDGTFLLAKDGNPIFLGSPAPGALFFCSTVDLLKKFCVDRSFGLGIWNIMEAPTQWYAVWNADGSLRDTGRFWLPVMREDPEYLRERNRNTSQQTETKKEEEERAEAIARLLNEQEEKKKDGEPISEPGRSLLQVVIPDANRYKNPDERVRAVSLPLGEVTKIAKDLTVICHWAGCWKKGRGTLPFATGHVALCKRHIDQCQKNNGSIVISNSGELTRKKREEVRRNA